jgi:hypothetical protein
VFTLATSFAMGGYTRHISITGDVTVLGNGAVLDAMAKGRFFDIRGYASLTLEDLTLQHGAVTDQTVDQVSAVRRCPGAYPARVRARSDGAQSV